MATIEDMIQLHGIENIVRCCQAACVATAHHVANILKKYPPTTESNQPGRWTHPAEGQGQPRPMGYYERNRGWWSPIMTKQTLYNQGRLGKSRGSIAAPARVKNSVAGYRLRPVSEMLGKKWIVQAIANGALLINSATYARLVQDAQMQTELHAAHNWTTIQAAIEMANQENVTGDAFMQALGEKPSA